MAATTQNILARIEATAAPYREHADIAHSDHKATLASGARKGFLKAQNEYENILLEALDGIELKKIDDNPFQGAIHPYQIVPNVAGCGIERFASYLSQLGIRCLIAPQLLFDGKVGAKYIAETTFAGEAGLYLSERAVILRHPSFPEFHELKHLLGGLALKMREDPGLMTELHDTNKDDLYASVSLDEIRAYADSLLRIVYRMQRPSHDRLTTDDTDYNKAVLTNIENFFSTLDSIHQRGVQELDTIIDFLKLDPSPDCVSVDHFNRGIRIRYDDARSVVVPMINSLDVVQNGYSEVIERLIADYQLLLTLSPLIERVRENINLLSIESGAEKNESLRSLDNACKELSMATDAPLQNALKTIKRGKILNVAAA